MTNWQPDIDDRSGPRYLALADALSDDIASGQLNAGDRLPTHRDLAWRLGVTVGTVSRAYAEAERRGLTSGEVGRGTYVRGATAAMNHVLSSKEQDDEDTVHMNFAFPPPGCEAQYIPEILNSLARDPQTVSNFGYQPQGGSWRHRIAGVRWIEQSGLANVDPERVVLTAGAHHGMTVALSAITRPGDRIVTEALTYPGIQAISRVLGLRIEGLPLDAEGIIPEAFEAVCRNNDIKALYCVPTCQNPTTKTMSAARRDVIAEIALRFAVAVVEDDVFGRFVESPPTPIAALLPDLGYYVTSLTKAVAPGLRVGYVAGPRSATDRLTSAIRATCWMASPLTAEIAARWIETGISEEILTSRRREGRQRRAIALDVLSDWDIDCADDSTFMWLHLPDPWRSSDFAAAAAKRGVTVTSAEAFTVGRRETPHAVRVCFGQPANQKILRSGLETLSQILRSEASDFYLAVV
ncbi:PLP-dependent aminotransferase family protein [Pelagibius sp. Alg239-R121]|uniref:MocR-like ectoine utilization transcription factor EhuR n=1 Tax=Pelagibius sp. Alg239-R121 TaxID=2993448 RepID=UPI0024A65110|nr:PLP-dependent aminotransferase family protein [Pelagibius sp. Alg239-R121]